MQACSLIRVIKHRLSEVTVNFCLVLCPFQLFAYGVMSSKQIVNLEIFASLKIFIL